LLPYIEQNAIAQNWDYTRRWHQNPKNRDQTNTRIRLLECPAAPTQSKDGIFRAWNDSGPKGATTDYTMIRGPAVYDSGGGVFAPVMPGVVMPDPYLGRQEYHSSGALIENFGMPIAGIIDGTSTTLAMVEIGGRPDRWENGRRVYSYQEFLANQTSANWNKTSADESPWAHESVTIRPRGASFAGVRNNAAAGQTGECVINCTNNKEVYSFHTGGAHFLFLDGSVRFISQKLKPLTFAQLITRNGGEAISGEY
jgi:prepilin-type processing-associated H-X9-DG protein